MADALLIPTDVAPPPADMAWYLRDRFGLFVSWGPSTLSLGELGWNRFFEDIPDDVYQERYVDHFDPDLYNPVAWARAARQAGMKYVVLTVKHIDGYCLWDSDETDFKATAQAAGRDLVAPFVEAFRNEGIRIGFYYALIDWHHPDFTLDGMHPLRKDPAARAARGDRQMPRYAAYMRRQVTELLTRYGKVDLLWFDFSYPNWSVLEKNNFHLFATDPTRGEWIDTGKGKADWESEELVALARTLQPGIIINDRADVPGDYISPEQHVPAKPPTRDGKPVPWETCATMNDAWAYRRDDRKWKSTDQLVRMLINTVSKGGNLLLNVGPNGRGDFPQPSVERLAEIGEWMRVHGRSIYGCKASEFTPPPDARYTQNGERLYLHLFAWPFDPSIHLPGLAGRVRYAQMVHDGSEVKSRVIPAHEGQMDTAVEMRLAPDALTLTVTTERPDVVVPVIEVFLDERPQSQAS